MSETLKNLLVESSALEDKLIEMVGELTPELEQSLMVLETKIPQKVTNYCRLLDRLELEGENLLLKSKKYGDAAKALLNLQERLLANVKNNMIENGLTELRGNSECFKITKGKESVQITDLSQLPRNYVSVTITEQPSKAKIYDAIKSGETLSGCHLQEAWALKRQIIKGLK